MAFSFSLRGDAKLAAFISLSIARGRDLRDAWRRVSERIVENERKQFASEGGLTGGWKPLNETYRQYKAARRGLHETIMVRSGDLRRSMTNPYDSNSVLRLKRHEFEQGTTLPYADAHDQGLGVPKREVLVWRKEDEDFTVEAIKEHLGFA